MSVAGLISATGRSMTGRRQNGAWRRSRKSRNERRDLRLSKQERPCIMGTVQQRHRSVESIVFGPLYPGGGISPDPELQGVRYQAVVEVLSRIPEKDYQRLCDVADTFQWFLPDPSVRGM